MQGRLDHEVSSMTMDVYARMMGGNDREAADLLEIQRGAGAPITIDGSRITVMAREA